MKVSWSQKKCLIAFAGLMSLACKNGGGFNCCGSAPPSASQKQVSYFDNLTVEKCYDVSEQEAKKIPLNDWANATGIQLVSIKLSVFRMLDKEVIDLLNKGGPRPLSNAEIQSIKEKISASNPHLSGAEIDAEMFCSSWQDRLISI